MFAFVANKLVVERVVQLVVLGIVVLRAQVPVRTVRVLLELVRTGMADGAVTLRQPFDVVVVAGKAEGYGGSLEDDLEPAAAILELSPETSHACHALPLEPELILAFVLRDAASMGP